MLITPPFFARARIISSVMLRGTAERALQEEWDAITGALLAASASSNVLSETWEISTIMPSRFIRWTTCRPKSVRPFQRGLSVAESAQPVFLVGVRGMYR